MSKLDLAQKATNHTTHMEAAYGEDIKRCIQNSVIYSEDTKFNKPLHSDNHNIYLWDKDSVKAAQHCATNPDFGKVTVLNFASYRNPGGKFLDGSMAQEEALCHSSYLYNVLKGLPEYYEWNNEHKNNALYTNRAIYSPDILFNPGSCNEFRCDVVTCAAPNLNPYYKYNNGSITLQDNTKALDSRITFLIKICIENNIDTFVIGAWGCGVFRQSPSEVCKLFLKNIDSYSGGIKNFIFAIPDENSKNYLAFKEVLNDDGF